MSLSTEANRQAAKRLLAMIGTGKIDAALLAEDFIHWSPVAGELDADSFIAVIAKFATLFDPPLVLHIDGITAEGDRVAIEAHSDAALRAGGRYRNHYHHLFEFAGDGRIRRVNEHMDSRHAVEMIQPLFAALG